MATLAPLVLTLADRKIFAPPSSLQPPSKKPQIAKATNPEITEIIHSIQAVRDQVLEVNSKMGETSDNIERRTFEWCKKNTLHTWKKQEGVTTYSSLLQQLRDASQKLQRINGQVNQLPKTTIQSDKRITSIQKEIQTLNKKTEKAMKQLESNMQALKKVNTLDWHAIVRFAAEEEAERMMPAVSKL